MRERFESPEDRANQAALAKELKRTLGWSFRPLFESNAHYNLDYFATLPGSTKGAAWVEVKFRNNRLDAYPTVMLSAGKWIEGCRASRETGLPFILFFRFHDDGVYRYEYDANHEETRQGVEFEWGGRSKKDRDAADFEPTAMIPTRLWTKVDIAPEPEPEEHPF